MTEQDEQAQDRLIAELSPLLSEAGFSRARPWSFIRRVGEGVAHTLSFGVGARESGGFSFACGVGIRFDQVEQLIGRSDDNPYKATIGVPIHFLREDQQYAEWYFSNAAGAKRIVPDVISDVTRYAFPFFENYSSINRVRAQLEHAPPSDWLGQTSESRIQVLTGIVFVQEGPRSALEFLSRVLTAPTTRPPLRKGGLLVLKKKIESRLLL